MERQCSYPRRSHGRFKQLLLRKKRSKACREKSADVIVVQQSITLHEGLNLTIKPLSFHVWKNSLRKKQVKVHIIRLKASSSPVSNRSKQTFFDFFLKTGVTFPIFSSLIYETRLVAVAERHTRSDCGLYLLDTIYMYQIYRGTHRGAPLCVFTI